MKLNRESGLDVLLQVKSVYPGLPVILITGYAEEMAVEVAKSLEKNAYICLMKPVNITELLGIIKEIRIKDSWRVQEDVLY